MQVLEHVKERTLPGERREDVVHADEHRALPFLGVARRLGRARKVQELRERLDGGVRHREAQLAQLRAELLRGGGTGRVDPELDEERLDEAGIAALVHAREGPAHDARRVGGADALLGRGREPDELGEQAALADTRLPRDEDHLGAADARRLVGEVETRQLHPPSHERRARDSGRARRRALARERVRENWLGPALDLDRPDLAERELAVRQAERRLGDVDLSRRGRRLETRGDVHRVPHDAVLGDAADGSGDHHARVDADAQAELDAALGFRPRGVLGEDALHADRGPQGALRVVLVGDRCAEDDEDSVADELLDRAVVADGLLGEVLEDPRDEDLEVFGVKLVRQLREPHEIGEEDRDEAPLLLNHFGSADVTRSRLVVSLVAHARCGSLTGAPLLARLSSVSITPKVSSVPSACDVDCVK